MARMTFLDYVLASDSAEMQIGKALIKDKPELGLLPLRAVPGFLFKTTEKAVRPTVSPRAHNQGSASVKTTSVPAEYKLAQYKQPSEVDTSLLDGLSSVDASRYRFDEATQIAEAITDSFGTAMYYGDVASDPNSFDGFGVRAGSLNTTKANNSPIVVGEGGSSGLTSIYAMRIGGMGSVELLYQEGSSALPQFKDRGVLNVSDGTNDFTAYVTDVTWVAGLRMPNYGLGRLANIDDSSNKATVANLSKLKRLMGGGNIALFANPTVMQQLDAIASGSITYYQNDANLATEVMTIYNMPVFSSDLITNSEAQVS